MKRARPPSETMIVAILVFGAVVLAPKIAGAQVVTSTRARRIAKREVRALAPGLSVAHADTADSAEPTLFARVLANGTVDASLSKGVTSANVTQPAVGVYCFSDPPGVKGGQVTVDYATAASVGMIAQFGLGVGSGCPQGTQFFVSMFDASTATFPDSGFFLLLYR